MPEFSEAGRGKSWECACSQHGSCRLGGCVCNCHYRLGAADTLKREIVQSEPGKVANPPSDGDVNVAPAASVQANPQSCPKCSTIPSTGAKFCRHCGFAFVLVIFCENCGVKATSRDQYCESCGAPLGNEVKVKSPRKKKANGQAQS